MLGFVMFIVMVLVLIGVISALWTIFTGAPWEPMPMKRVEQMLTLARLQPGEVLYDLGSGDGRIIIMAARRFKANAVGVEIDPLRWVGTQILITVLGLRKRVRVIWGSFYDQDVSKANVVTAFLVEQTNRKLAAKLKSELQAGARLVAYEFGYPEWTPADTNPDAKLFLYEF